MGGKKPPAPPRLPPGASLKPLPGQKGKPLPDAPPLTDADLKPGGRLFGVLRDAAIHTEVTDAADPNAPADEDTPAPVEELQQRRAWVIDSLDRAHGSAVQARDEHARKLDKYSAVQAVKGEKGRVARDRNRTADDGRSPREIVADVVRQHGNDEWGEVRPYKLLPHIRSELDAQGVKHSLKDKYLTQLIRDARRAR